MDARTLRARLLELYPDGVSGVVDFSEDEDPGRYLTTASEVLKAYGTDQADDVARETSPLTCVDVLPTWESDLGLSGTKAAISGTVAQRQQQLLSRMRERGALTVARIQAVLAPLLGYADPSQLIVKTTSRSELRALHTYQAGAVLPLDLPASVYFRVMDDAKVSPTGAQVDVTLSVTALEDCTFTLVSPAGTSVTQVNALGEGATTAEDFRLYFPDCAGLDVLPPGKIASLWRLDVTGTGTLDAASLFLEGFGRDSSKLDGLGAAIFYWAAVYEPAKSSGGADLDAARAAIRRINFGTRLGFLCRAMEDGSLYLIPGDDNSFPPVLPGS